MSSSVNRGVSGLQSRHKAAKETLDNIYRILLGMGAVTNVRARVRSVQDLGEG